MQLTKLENNAAAWAKKFDDSVVEWRAGATPAKESLLNTALAGKHGDEARAAALIFIDKDKRVSADRRRGREAAILAGEAWTSATHDAFQARVMSFMADLSCTRRGFHAHDYCTAATGIRCKDERGCGATGEIE